METKTVVIRDWEDLVFDHRNKDYGAYALRRAYSRRLILGWGLSTALMAVMLMLPGVLPESVKVPKIPVIIDKGLISLDRYIPPTIEPQTPRRGESASQPNNANRTVRVVTEPVEAPTEIDATAPPIPSEGVGSGGIENGLGTDVVVAVTPPAVPTGPRLTAEVMPTYEGGLEAMMKFIQKKTRYPSSAKRLNIDGTVFVSFVVNGDGSVSDVEVLRGIHPDCDKEAMRVISLLPDWIGGKQNGFPVAVKLALPIKFSLHNN
jgi:periplasmic protein TonB